MADFPSARFHLPVISSFGPETGGLAAAAISGAITVVGGTATWPSANLAIYVPFRIWAPYPVRRLWWANGTAVAGNVDCGILSANGTLITSAGSTAQSGTSTIQTATPAELLLSPGSYYMALNSSSTSAQFMRAGLAAAGYAAQGWAQQAVGAVAIPAAATFAAYAQTYQPLFGIASATVI